MDDVDARARSSARREFMSPEQARGKETDRRTDIWAFGCILYEMLSGRKAFTGETVPDAVAAILYTRAGLGRAARAHARSECGSFCVGCLEKDPGRRLRDAGDARLELEATLAGLSGAAVVGHPSRPVPWKLLGAAALGAAVAIGAYLALRTTFRRCSPGLAPARGSPLPKPDGLARRRAHGPRHGGDDQRTTLQRDRACRSSRLAPRRKRWTPIRVSRASPGASAPTPCSRAASSARRSGIGSSTDSSTPTEGSSPPTRSTARSSSPCRTASPTASFRT